MRPRWNTICVGPDTDGVVAADDLEVSFNYGGVANDAEGKHSPKARRNTTLMKLKKSKNKRARWVH